MTNIQSKFSIYQSLIPAKYVSRITLELQRTFLVAMSLLKTHRRKAFLLSLGPATILKFVTIMLPIIKLLPPTIKAIKALSTFASSNSRRNNSSNSNGANALANREANAAAVEGVGMSMDELNEILWTPAEDTYWERVHAMVTRFGLCKTLGVTLAGVRPGRVEVTMPFRSEVSGEGGAFHASLLPTLIAMTSQLTGTTLLPRHFTLKPIDFKCNILSDCDPSTYLLVSRGAVVVRGDHSITVKVEIMKASGLIPGSSEVVTSPSSGRRSPSSFPWKSRSGSSSTGVATPTTPSANSNPSVLVPGTGIERNKFVVCATGMQTSVVVRAGTDHHNEEENEIQRLRRERELRSKRSFSSSSSTASFSYEVDAGDDSAIVLGDSFRPSRPISPTTPREPRSQHPYQHPQQQFSSHSLDGSSYEASSTMSSFMTESKNTDPLLSRTSTATVIPMSYASAVRYGVDHEDSAQHFHPYDEGSDTEAWKR